MSRRKIDFHNTPPSDQPLPENAPKAAVKAEFARRLQKAMAEKGWTQSELASRAAKFTDKGEFGRYSVSLYIQGKTLPRPHQLEALCKALGKKPADLLPTRGVPNSDEVAPPLDVRDTGDGKAWIRINQEVKWPVALEIIKLLKEDSKGR